MVNLMKKIELLAPAGSLSKAKIAFMYGADAVYAGTSKLSLRSRAEMDSDDLKDTIEYAHKLGKKVYVAMNIYDYDEDYDEIKAEIKRLDLIKADAIIASDPGVIQMIKEVAPNMEIHISTQANVTSVHSAKFWYNYGAKRVILARELSKDKIEYIVALKNNQDIKFNIINELTISGSDVGPKKNFINSKEITDYFQNMEENNEKAIDS